MGCGSSKSIAVHEAHANKKHAAKADEKNSKQHVRRESGSDDGERMSNTPRRQSNRIKQPYYGFPTEQTFARTADLGLADVSEHVEGTTFAAATISAEIQQATGLALEATRDEANNAAQHVNRVTQDALNSAEQAHSDLQVVEAKAHEEATQVLEQPVAAVATIAQAEVIEVVEAAVEDAVEETVDDAATATAEKAELVSTPSVSTPKLSVHPASAETVADVLPEELMREAASALAEVAEVHVAKVADLAEVSDETALAAADVVQTKATEQAFAPLNAAEEAVQSGTQLLSEPEIVFTVGMSTQATAGSPSEERTQAVDELKPVASITSFASTHELQDQTAPLSSQSGTGIQSVASVTRRMPTPQSTTSLAAATAGEPSPPASSNSDSQLENEIYSSEDRRDAAANVLQPATTHSTASINLAQATTDVVRPSSGVPVDALATKSRATIAGTQPLQTTEADDQAPSSHIASEVSSRVSSHEPVQPAGHLDQTQPTQEQSPNTQAVSTQPSLVIITNEPANSDSSASVAQPLDSSEEPPASKTASTAFVAQVPSVVNTSPSLSTQGSTVSVAAAAHAAVNDQPFVSTKNSRVSIHGKADCNNMSQEHLERQPSRISVKSQLESIVNQSSTVQPATHEDNQRAVNITELLSTTLPESPCEVTDVKRDETPFEPQRAETPSGPSHPESANAETCDAVASVQESAPPHPTVEAVSDAGVTVVQAPARGVVSATALEEPTNSTFNAVKVVSRTTSTVPSDTACETLVSDPNQPSTLAPPPPPPPLSTVTTVTQQVNNDPAGPGPETMQGSTPVPSPEAAPTNNSTLPVDGVTKAEPAASSNVTQPTEAKSASSATTVFKEYPDSYASKQEYHDALLAFARSQAGSSGEAPDYSEAFGGGSHEEYKMEKEFEKLVANTEGADLGRSDFELTECICGTESISEHDDNCPGEWLRTLNQQGSCYLYIHTITHEIRGSRPPGFKGVEEQPVEEKKPEPAKPAEPTGPTTTVANSQDCIREFWNNGKVVLLLAGTTQQALLDHLQSQNATIFDTRPFILPIAKTGVKFADAAENLRVQAMNAMKAGRALVLNCFDKTPNFKEKLCEAPKFKDCFPVGMFDPRDTNSHGKLFKLAQGDGFPVFTPGYHLVLLTTLDRKTALKEFSQVAPMQFVEIVQVTS